MSKQIVLCTGAFDPIHSGHIAYIRAAKKLGDILVVGVNSDQWLTRKKGVAFMSIMERVEIVQNIKGVDYVIGFDDSDNTAKDAIRRVRLSYPKSPIIFVNGGDRTKRNTPEFGYPDKKLEFLFGVGGPDKRNSSSWLLQEWKAPKTERPWGYYRVLHEEIGVKVKELTIDCGQSLSMQRHNTRSEYWLVADGKVDVAYIMENGQTTVGTLTVHEDYTVLNKTWHQLSNPYDKPARIIEIQYGESCSEDDIQRM